MFFIFGWGHQTVNDKGATMPLECPNCRNQVWYNLVATRSWFTLFFIPVIPYESHNYLLCQVCSQGLELAGDQVAGAEKLNLLADAFHRKELSEDQFLAEVRGANLLQLEEVAS